MAREKIEVSSDWVLGVLGLGFVMFLIVALTLWAEMQSQRVSDEDHCKAIRHLQTIQTESLELIRCPPHTEKKLTAR